MCRNCITVYNTGKDEILPCTPVEIGARIDCSGLSDDFCFEAKAANSRSRIIGISDCAIYPGTPGRAVISGIATCRIANFFEQGDRIAPDDSGAWQAVQSGEITVISPADEHGLGSVMLSTPSAPAASGAYGGFFNVRDISDSKTLKIRISGGTTDLGTVNSAELEITQNCDIYLVAQYISSEDGDGSYQLHFTSDILNDENITTQYYGEWLIATIGVSDGRLLIIQQHQCGAIYFGTRYWVK